MPIDAILESARSGLAYERQRLDTASRNIASANVPLPPQISGPAGMAVGYSGSFEDVLAMPGKHEPADMPTREVYDPSHPMANGAGMVRYPRTDVVEEMTTLMTASRGYEANVRALNMLRGMSLQALEIGAK